LTITQIVFEYNILLSHQPGSGCIGRHQLQRMSAKPAADGVNGMLTI
jgi:hypothetical protein